MSLFCNCSRCVFNVAHGAVATMCALVYWQLRFDWGMPAPLAIILTIFVFAPMLGVLLETIRAYEVADLGRLEHLRPGGLDELRLAFGEHHPSR